jgi:hypothetical protein
VHEALLNGRRGLPGGSSLAMLLAEHRGVRNKGQLPHLKKRQILAWADAHFRRTGNYPNHKSGPIPEAPGESWSIVAHAFYRGHRGLPANYSLHKFLAEHGRRHIPPPRAPRIPKPLRPPLQLTQILRWADAHHARTGGFPKQGDGPIVEAPDTTWKAVDLALRKGSRGLPKRGSLRKFLIRSGREPILHRGFPPGTCLRPQLKLSQVLAWAKTHYRRTGTWPRRCSGRIPGARGETWNGVDHALARGARGLPASGSLYTFLLAHRAKPARTRRTS